MRLRATTTCAADRPRVLATPRFGPLPPSCDPAGLAYSRAASSPPLYACMRPFHAPVRLTSPPLAVCRPLLAPPFTVRRPRAPYDAPACAFSRPRSQYIAPAPCLPPPLTISHLLTPSGAPAHRMSCLRALLRPRSPYVAPAHRMPPPLAVSRPHTAILCPTPPSACFAGPSQCPVMLSQRPGTASAPHRALCTHHGAVLRATWPSARPGAPSATHAAVCAPRRTLPMPRRTVCNIPTRTRQLPTGVVAASSRLAMPPHPHHSRTPSRPPHRPKTQPGRQYEWRIRGAEQPKEGFIGKVFCFPVSSLSLPVIRGFRLSRRPRTLSPSRCHPLPLASPSVPRPASLRAALASVVSSPSPSVSRTGPCLRARALVSALSPSFSPPPPFFRARAPRFWVSVRQSRLPATSHSPSLTAPPASPRVLPHPFGAVSNLLRGAISDRALVPALRPRTLTPPMFEYPAPFCACAPSSRVRSPPFRACVLFRARTCLACRRALVLRTTHRRFACCRRPSRSTAMRFRAALSCRTAAIWRPSDAVCGPQRRHPTFSRRREAVLHPDDAVSRAGFPPPPGFAPHLALACPNDVVSRALPWRPLGLRRSVERIGIVPRVCRPPRAFACRPSTAAPRPCVAVLCPCVRATLSLAPSPPSRPTTALAPRTTPLRSCATLRTMLHRALFAPCGPSCAPPHRFRAPWAMSRPTLPSSRRAAHFSRPAAPFSHTHAVCAPHRAVFASCGSSRAPSRLLHAPSRRLAPSCPPPPSARCTTHCQRLAAHSSRPISLSARPYAVCAPHRAVFTPRPDVCAPPAVYTTCCALSAPRHALFTRQRAVSLPVPPSSRPSAPVSCPSAPVSHFVVPSSLSVAPSCVACFALQRHLVPRASGSYLLAAVMRLSRRLTC
ncbi:hypothetical protein DENSPDRAFT_885470 [Dentipellis sp. KUC8613]|nr:hypothetical protein DENSPDRAFT_885470 [Dentipellis sp. KUC8613]